mmetsp:Transcript_16523/g.57867  ORF Transcript_16523/g.57867 Transcript_16523/m.57867 type:complete len:289 (+) Transcript_16523:1036-1902(+)
MLVQHRCRSLNRPTFAPPLPRDAASGRVLQRLHARGHRFGALRTRGLQEAPVLPGIEIPPLAPQQRHRIVPGRPLARDADGWRVRGQSLRLEPPEQTAIGQQREDAAQGSPGLSAAAASGTIGKRARLPQGAQQLDVRREQAPGPEALNPLCSLARTIVAQPHSAIGNAAHEGRSSELQLRRPDASSPVASTPQPLSSSQHSTTKRNSCECTLNARGPSPGGGSTLKRRRGSHVLRHRLRGGPVASPAQTGGEPAAARCHRRMTSRVCEARVRLAHTTWNAARGSVLH